MARDEESSALDESLTDYVMRGEIVDKYGHVVRCFSGNDITDHHRNSIASIQGEYLIDRHGKRTPLKEILKTIPSESIVAIAAMWLLLKK
jgi:hypothetical protein